MAEITVHLLDNVATIRKKILDELSGRITQAYKVSSQDIQHDIQDLLRINIAASPTFQEMFTSGDFLGEIGIPNHTDALNQILEIIVQKIKVSSDPVRNAGGRLTGALKITGIDTAYVDILSHPASSYTTDKGVVIPFMEWLLTAGTTVLVRDYFVQFGRFKNSRTGLALMKFAEGTRWRIEPPHAGTVGNNFITRAIDAIPDSAITTILQKRVLQGLNSAS